MQAPVTDRVYNVASGVETSLRDLAETLLRVMGSSQEIEFGPERPVNKVSRRLADTSAAARDLGFKAEISLEQGLQGLVQWWRSERGTCRRGREHDQHPGDEAPPGGGRGAGCGRGGALGLGRPGPRVAEFEKQFAAAVGASHAVALSSCTTALHLGLVVLGIGPGDEVVVPSLSFIATANSVRYVGAEPVFADVEAATGNVTAETVEQCSGHAPVR